MMKLLRLSTFLFLFTFVINSKVSAQTYCDTVTWIAPLPQGNNLNDVISTDANTFYAAGNYGTVLKSSDAGQHWTILDTKSTADFNSIYFTDANTGYIAGSGGAIFKTVDAGLSWKALSVPTTSNMSSVYFTDANTGYAAGGDNGSGVIVKTSNAGASWSILSSPAASSIISISFSVTTGYFTGTYNELLKTSDGGLHWETKHPGGAPEYTSSAFPTATVGYISSYKYQSMQTSYNTQIMKTTDGGANWVAVYNHNDATGQNQHLYFRDADVGFRSGRAGHFEKTTNGGFTWDSVGTGFYRSIVFSDASHGVAVGIDGSIIRTVDGGSNWQTIVGISIDFTGVSFTDINTGYATSGDGSIYKTSNAGQNWTQVKSPEGYIYLHKIFFPDALTGYAIGSTGIVFKTPDAGVTWIKDSLPTFNMLTGIYFLNPSTGFILDDGGGIFKTNDGGSNWSLSTVSPNVYLDDVFFTNAQTGYIVGGINSYYQQAVIFKTTDGGDSWVLIPSGTSNPLTSVFFTDVNTGYASGYTNTIIKTTDGGATWNTLSAPGQTYTSYYKVVFTNKSRGYLVGDEIMHTMNGGNTWSLLKSSQLTQMDVSFPVSNIGYTVGYGGSILKISNCNGGEIYGDSSVCNGSNVSYHVDSLSGISYSWSLSGGGTLSGNGRNAEVNWNLNGDYILTVTPSSGTPMTLIVHVDGMVPPGAVTIQGNTSAMVGNLFVYKVGNPLAGINYNWTLSGGGIISAQGDSAKVKWSDTGTYSISVTPSNYCGNGASATLTVIVNGHMVHSCNEVACVCPGVNSDLTSVSFISADRGMAVGDLGVILKTYNGGASWLPLRSKTKDYLSSVKMLTKDIAIAVGNNGTILKTTNGGSNWISMNSGVKEILFSVFFTDLINGYATGANGTILKTTDGGVNWVVFNYTPAVNLNSVYFINPNTGFIGGANGTLLKTTNGGISWSSIQVTGNDLYSINFVDLNTGYISGDLGTVLKTSDGGDHWNILNSHTQEVLYGIGFANASKGYAVGTNGIVLKTTDGGNSWGAIDSGQLNELVTVATINLDTAYVVGFAGTALKIYSDVSCQPGAITGDTVVYVGNTSCYSTDDVNGLAYVWSLSGGGMISSSGNSCSIEWTGAGIYTLMVVPSSGITQTLNVRVKDPITTSVSSGNLPLNFSIYPNPNKGNFRIDLPSSGIYSAKLIDMMGQVAWTGNFRDISNEMACGNLAKGIYYLHIASENQAGTSKLVVE